MVNKRVININDTNGGKMTLPKLQKKPGHTRERKENYMLLKQQDASIEEKIREGRLQEIRMNGMKWNANQNTGGARICPEGASGPPEKLNSHQAIRFKGKKRLNN